VRGEDLVVNPIRVLVVDDHAVVRDGIGSLIGYQADMEVVGTAGTGREAVRLFPLCLPDVVLLDLQMPDGDGLYTLAGIRLLDPLAKVLVLTTFDGDEDIFRALKAGARGYLLKDCSGEQLIRGIRKVAAGDEVLEADSVAKLEGRGPALSPRELEVLGFVARGLSNREIADALFIGEATVKAHVLHVFTKLDVSDRVDAVRVAVKRGLVRL